jgi:hypothetical protein
LHGMYENGTLTCPLSNLIIVISNEPVTPDGVWQLTESEMIAKSRKEFESLKHVAAAAVELAKSYERVEHEKRQSRYRDKSQDKYRQKFHSRL